MSDEDSKVPLPDLENSGEMQTVEDAGLLAPSESDSFTRGASDLEARLDASRATGAAAQAAMAAERSDVSEELLRLRSHVEQFESLLTTGAEVGKKLDFLLQEMQREANTLLSKTPGNEAEGLAIAQFALEIKSEIEKLREQVQNIE